MPFKVTPPPYCKKCDPSNGIDYNKRFGQWSDDCEFKKLIECQGKCTLPPRITGPSPGPVGGCPPAPSPVGGVFVPSGNAHLSGAGLSSASPSTVGGFGFLPSGGVVSQCACASGLEWKKSGDHPCGCSRSMSPTLSEDNGTSERRGLSSAARESGCSSCCCCLRDVVVSSEHLEPGDAPDSDPGYGVVFYGNVGRIGNSIGSSFTLDVGVYDGVIRWPATMDDDLRCTMEWFERANQRRDELPNPNIWRNLTGVHMVSKMLGKGAQYGLVAEWLRATQDPCANTHVALRDQPRMEPLGNGQVLVGGQIVRLDHALDIHVRLRSGEACECPTRSLVVQARQILKSAGQSLTVNGSTMNFIKHKNSANTTPPTKNTLPSPIP